MVTIQIEELWNGGGRLFAYKNTFFHHEIRKKLISLGFAKEERVSPYLYSWDKTQHTLKFQMLEKEILRMENYTSMVLKHMLVRLSVLRSLIKGDKDDA